MTKYYDHKDLLKIYKDALQRGDSDSAATLIYVMAEACPIRKDECLVTKFCPDCDFYKNNGIIQTSELEKYTGLENNIPSKEGE